jgi:Tfp pilus assembly protein FimT
LILVMAMLLTVIAVSIPSLSNFFRGRTLDSEARRFLSLTRYGQSRAVSEGVPMKLWIDTKEGSYGLEQEQSSTDGDPKAVSFDLDDDLSLELTILPSRSSVLAPTGQPGEPRRTVPTIRFQPDGFISETSPQGVWIRERAGARKDNVIGIALSRNRLNYEIQTNALQNPAR